MGWVLPTQRSTIQPDPVTSFTLSSSVQSARYFAAFLCAVRQLEVKCWVTLIGGSMCSLVYPAGVDVPLLLLGLALPPELDWARSPGEVLVLEAGPLRVAVAVEPAVRLEEAVVFRGMTPPTKDGTGKTEAAPEVVGGEEDADEADAVEDVLDEERELEPASVDETELRLSASPSAARTRAARRSRMSDVDLGVREGVLGWSGDEILTLTTHR